MLPAEAWTVGIERSSPLRGSSVKPPRQVFLKRHPLGADELALSSTTADSPGFLDRLPMKLGMMISL
jgi:hypothetical protein